MSDSVRPHRWQPTRLPCPWDSPSKNTGVGCHFLLHYMTVESESEVPQSCLTLVTSWTAAHQALRPWDFPGKSTGVGCHCLLRSNNQRTLYLSMLGLNKILEVKKFLETGRLSKIWCCVLVFSYSFSDKVCSLKQSNSNQRANTDL